jgi:hypothetical protein
MNKLDQSRKVPNSKSGAQLLQKQFGPVIYYRVSIGLRNVGILFVVFKTIIFNNYFTCI